MTPKHSIITLTYNRPDYLDEAIWSIESQTDQDYQHIVRDNGSTDPRVRKVLVAAEARSRKFQFEWLRVNECSSVGRHWNALLEQTTGKYITILDDDNRKRPTFLQDMSFLMDTDDAIEAVTCGWAVIDGSGKLTGEEKHTNLDSSLKALWRDNTIDSGAVMFRRTVLDKIGMFNEALTTNEDWDFMIRLVRRCRVVHLRECLLEYRVHSGARSRSALELGAHDNWKKIRDKNFTKEEQMRFLREYTVESRR